MDNKKTLYIIFGVVIIIALALAALYLSGTLTPPSLNQEAQKETPRVIKENLVIPDTTNITGSEARVIENGKVEVPLVPKSEGEKVIVPNATLTTKESYNLALTDVQRWAADAIPVFVKSLGAVTLEGKSSQWQLAFSSATKIGKGYEVIIQGDRIVSQKEVDSTATGAVLPENWKDSGGAVAGLQELPQFSDATVSTINLYYNADGKIWRYAFATSKGTTSMSLE